MDLPTTAPKVVNFGKLWGPLVMPHVRGICLISSNGTGLSITTSCDTQMELPTPEAVYLNIRERILLPCPACLLTTEYWIRLPSDQATRGEFSWHRCFSNSNATSRHCVSYLQTSAASF